MRTTGAVAEPAGKAGVLGRPVEHSLSPVLHRAAYAALGLNWTYDAIDCGVDELSTVLADRADWAGFSATMPLKHALLDVAVEVRERAASIGAANTLLARPAGWLADNTDAYGIAAALSEHDVRPRSVTLLGAGGTAQAVLAALVELGLGGCTVLVREPSRAGALTATAERLGAQVSVDILAAGHPALAVDLVVSTLPPGAADEFAARDWTSEQAVLDVVYRPWPTPLAAAAAAGGATVVSGALMLLHQAAEQVRLMTGRDAPVEAMREALHTAAPNCGV
jgi:shikimate dehydrogenase